MKVVKLGNKAPQKNWPQRFECKECESILEVSASDITGQRDQRDGDWSEFTCPVCGKRNFMEYDIYAAAQAALRGPTIH